MARLKVTSRRKTSVPAKVPNAARRGGKFSSEDIHKVLFPEGPPEPKSLAELNEGVRLYVRERHARG